MQYPSPKGCNLEAWIDTRLELHVLNETFVLFDFFLG
jgi:hypothetical protein